MVASAWTVSVFDFQFHAKYAIGTQEWFSREAVGKIPWFSLFPVLPIPKLFAAKTASDVRGMVGQLTSLKSSNSAWVRLTGTPLGLEKSADSEIIGKPNGMSTKARSPTPATIEFDCSL